MILIKIFQDKLRIYGFEFELALLKWFLIKIKKRVKGSV